VELHVVGHKKLLVSVNLLGTLILLQRGLAIPLLEVCNVFFKQDVALLTCTQVGKHFFVVDGLLFLLWLAKDLGLALGLELWCT
jgi:hypothetical protein